MHMYTGALFALRSTKTIQILLKWLFFNGKGETCHTKDTISLKGRIDSIDAANKNVQETTLPYTVKSASTTCQTLASE